MFRKAFQRLHGFLMGQTAEIEVQDDFLEVYRFAFLLALPQRSIPHKDAFVA
jgi:hypothetical protein